MNNNLSTRKLKMRIALLLVVSILTFVAAQLSNGSSTKAEPLKLFGSTSTSNPSPMPEPSPSPPYIPTFIRRVNLQANNLVYSEATEALYASVQSRDAVRGNSITRITPATGEIGPSVFIGSEPDRMAISDDGRTIWTHLNGVNAVRQFDVSTQTAGLQFFTGSKTPQPPLDMDVVPGHPLSVVVSRGFSEDSAGSVVVFDSGIKRPTIANTTGYGPVEFGADPSILYGAFNGGFIKFLVDFSGVTQSNVAEDFWPLGVSSFKYAGGLVYASTGAVADPENNVLRGTFPGVNSSAMAVDLANHRVFYVTGSGSGVVLQAFDSDTFLSIGSLTLPGVTGAPINLVRWGTNGLAFNTAPSFNSSDPNQVYILQTEFVSNVDPIPTGIQVETGFLFTSEGSSTASIKVLRTGDVSGSVSVNYATSDGTATAGLDYTATSGTLNFGPGELTKVISIPIKNDNLFENADEMFNLTLSGPTNSAILLTPAGATIIIRDDDSKPVVTFPSRPELTASYVVEGDSGMSYLSFYVFLTNPSVQDITVDYATADYDGSCKAGSDYVASSGTIRIPAGTTLVEASIPIIGDTVVEESEIFRIHLSNATNVTAIGIADHSGVIENDDTSVQLLGTTFNVNEGAGFATVTVVRVGDVTRTASVLYSTTDAAGLQNCTLANGKASERCDYGTAVGRIQFPIKEYVRFGETRETFIIPIVDDALVEGDETFTVNLSAPSGALLGGVVYSPITGVILGGATTATIKITDNDTSPAAQNPIDGVNMFVTQQYIDFLGRLPDTIGLQNWTDTLGNCPNGGFGEFDNPSCDRVHVSAGFFLSDEFRGRGYFAYKFYEVGFDRRPTYAEFVPDMAQIGGPQSPESEVMSKAAYTDLFVQRQEFKNRYDALSNSAYIDALETNAEVTLTDKAALVAALNANHKTRAQVLREIVELQSVTDKFFIRAFVVMQYFGYLRRDPDTIGYDNWVNTLTADSSNFRHVIYGFIYSDEYRRRFGP